MKATGSKKNEIDASKHEDNGKKLSFVILTAPVS